MIVSYVMINNEKYFVKHKSEVNRVYMLNNTRRSRWKFLSLGNREIALKGENLLDICSRRSDISRG